MKKVKASWRERSVLHPFFREKSSVLSFLGFLNKWNWLFFNFFFFFFPKEQEAMWLFGSEIFKGPEPVVL